jgi:hypothetical protein
MECISITHGKQEILRIYDNDLGHSIHVDLIIVSLVKIILKDVHIKMESVSVSTAEN